MPRRLQAVEEDLGLTPIWVASHDALDLNQTTKMTGSSALPWLDRDTRVLRALVACWD